MPPRSPITTPDWQAAVRRRTQFYLLIAVLLAVLFGVLVYQFFAGQQVDPGAFTSAVFVKQDVPVGMAITVDMLEVRQVPEDAVPSLHYSFIEQVIGRATLYPLVAGEVVLPSKLMGDQGGPMAQRCLVGYWCVNIPQDWFVAVPPDLAEGDSLEIAAVMPGNPYDDAGYIATDVVVVALPVDGNGGAYLLAVDDEEALSILYAHANEFQLLVLLRPAGG